MSRKTKYSREFREEAIKLCQANGANKAEIARSLGVTYKTLCNWTYGLGEEANSETQIENKKLKHEVARLKEEVEILKKAGANEASHPACAKRTLPNTLGKVQIHF